jgi:3-amino-5-hydroxybenzoic acid synthesis related protein
VSGQPSAAPLRVAVVGAGWAARSIWLPRLRAHPAITLAALADPDAAAWVLAAGEGVAHVARAEDLRAREIDLAIVAVPNHLHTAVAETLLRAGISVFVEKPVCLTSAEADRLAAAEFASGAVLLAGSAAAYRADVRAMLNAAGQIGKLRHISLGWVRARGIPGGPGWFTRRRTSGGGALMDLGWHLLDVVGPLLGTARFRQVVGSVSGDYVNDGSASARWRQDGPSRLGSDVEDTAHGFLLPQEGPSVTVATSWASHRRDDITTIVLEGSTGTLSLRCTFGFSPSRQDRPVLTLTRHGQDTELPLPDEPIGVEYDRLVDDLPRRLANPAMRGRPIREAARTIDTIERLYAAAAPRAERRPPRKASLPLHARGVIFDLDGVLVDSFDVMRQAFTLAYSEVGGQGEPPFEEYNRHLGRYFPDIMGIMGLPAEMEVPFVRESHRLASQVPLFPGVAELLRTLNDQGLKLAVATGKAGWRARSLLRQLGVLDRFEHVVGSDEVPRAKPAPDIVLRALDLLQVAAADAIMIGDAVTDLTAAKAAGVTAVAAMWGETDEPALLAADPDFVLRKPADLNTLWARPVALAG